jgi:hypothetical protein
VALNRAQVASRFFAARPRRRRRAPTAPQGDNRSTRDCQCRPSNGCPQCVDVERHGTKPRTRTGADRAAPRRHLHPRPGRGAILACQRSPKSDRTVACQPRTGRCIWLSPRCGRPNRSACKPLLFDLPPQGSLRPLARTLYVATARTSHLVALRLRRAIAVLIGQDSPQVAQAVNANPDSGLIRAAALAITSRGGIPLEWSRQPGPAEGAVSAVSPPRRVHLPGYPASALNDHLWQAAWPDAMELGAPPETFWDHIGAHGLLLPTSWIPHSWPVLWARALKDN